MALQYITKDILSRNGSGEALLDLPYDIGFNAGYDKDMLPDDFENAAYGHMIMVRSGTFIGAVGKVDSGSATCEIEIEKEGVNIFSTNPSFSGTDTMTSGTLSTTEFVSGDRITFRVVNYSSGQGLRVTLKCRV